MDSAILKKKFKKGGTMRHLMGIIVFFLLVCCKTQSQGSDISSNLASAQDPSSQYFHLHTPNGFVFPMYERGKWIFYITKDPGTLVGAQPKSVAKEALTPAVFKVSPIATYPQLVTFELLENKASGYSPLGLCLTTGTKQNFNNEISVDLCQSSDSNQRFFWYPEKRTIEVTQVSADKKTQCLDVWRDAQGKGWRFASLLIFYPCGNPRPSNQEFYVVPAM